MTLANKLNKLLDIKDQNQELLDLQKQVLNTHTKRYITVSEFTERYNYSATQQKGFRGRLNDPLMFLQNKTDSHGNPISGGKITYDVDVVEKWLDNNMR